MPQAGQMPIVDASAGAAATPTAPADLTTLHMLSDLLLRVFYHRGGNYCCIFCNLQFHLHPPPREGPYNTRNVLAYLKSLCHEVTFQPKCHEISSCFSHFLASSPCMEGCATFAGSTQ
jgi:hypothetical protein